jgi:phage shock protein PspC (stress-responsive transcriptional regulator)
MTSSAETTRPALRRDGERKLLFGVCAGIARALDADPAIVRGVTILLGLLTGPLAIVAYVATAAVVPRDDGRMLLGGDPPDRRENRLGWVAVVIGCILLLAAAPAFDVFWIDEPLSTPLLAAALIIGVVVLARANRERGATAPAGPEMTAATAVADAPSEAAADADAEAPADDAPATAVTRSEAPTANLPAARVAPSGPRFTPPPADTAVNPRPAPEPPRGRSVFLVVAGALVSAAAVIVVLQALGAYDLSATGVAIALGAGALVCGGAAAVFAGRRGTGATVAAGIVLALGAAGVAALDDKLDDGVGVATVRPVSTSAIAPEYRQGVGVLELDLRDIAFPAGVTPVKADLGWGLIEVHVPPDVRVESVGETVAGGDLAPQVVRKGRPAPVVLLDGHVDVGEVRVERHGD